MSEIVARVQASECRRCRRPAVDCSCHEVAAPPMPTLASLGVTAEHLAARITDFLPKVADVAAGLLDDPQLQGVTIVGTPGTGKTRLMVAMLRMALEDGDRRIGYFRAKRLFARLWSIYQPGSAETEEQVLEHFARLDWLAIDDLGHEGRASEAVIGALHDIVSERHGHYRPTLLTTNLSLQAIAERYDDAIASRIGSWPRIVMTGKDRRLA